KVALDPYSIAQSSKFAVYVWAQAEPSKTSYCVAWTSAMETWPCWTPLTYQLAVEVGLVVSYLMSSVYQVFAETVVPVFALTLVNAPELFSMYSVKYDEPETGWVSARTAWDWVPWVGTIGPICVTYTV